MLFFEPGKAKETLKIFHTPITKPTPAFLASPPFLAKISHPALQPFLKNLIPLFRKGAGLILTSCCVRYPNAVPFLSNRIPYSQLKSPKTHAI